MTELTLSVPEISCAHCQHSIEGAVGDLAGVESVTVDIEPRTVSLVFDDSAVDLGKIRAAIEGVGYEVADTDEA
ncbi:MAG: heavy-metal-associated domain-containing protein [Acidimicrobiia bacterium]